MGELGKSWLENWFQPILPPPTPTSDRNKFWSRAPIDTRFAATRSSCRPLSIYLTCKPWYVLELGDRCPQAWVSPEVKVWRWKWTIEHANGDGLCLDARWRDQGSRVCIELGVQVSRGAGRANDSAYGNSGPSGVVSACGFLFPRRTRTNVAAYGSGRGASCQRPGYQPRD
ncbi:hypothetical protein PIB30_002692 [Stylosanthes scabra]|uniref:Uncharacterized protein n=1 Tax=Stylosanthes scabra TaxID=79078 RepID=A0ABU6R3M8_9FABA|nr:hypothetical protein [Stylosanthes scabra]